MDIVEDELVDLIVAISMKDKTAFWYLYRMTSVRPFSVVFRIVKNKGDAEDILQEFYIKIWNHASRYKTTGRPLFWLIAISRHQAIDFLRAKPKHAQYPDNLNEFKDSGPDPETAVMASQTHARVNSWIDQLDAPIAAMVRSAYLDGLSYKEVAEKYNLPLNTVRTSLRRGLLKINKNSVGERLSPVKNLSIPLAFKQADRGHSLAPRRAEVSR